MIRNNASKPSMYNRLCLPISVIVSHMLEFIVLVSLVTTCKLCLFLILSNFMYYNVTLIIIIAHSSKGNRVIQFANCLHVSSKYVHSKRGWKDKHFWNAFFMTNALLAQVQFRLKKST